MSYNIIFFEIFYKISFIIHCKTYFFNMLLKKRSNGNITINNKGKKRKEKQESNETH